MSKTQCGTDHVEEQACPAGTYQPSSGASSSTMCIKCKAGTFNELVAQSMEVIPLSHITQSGERN